MKAGRFIRLFILAISVTACAEKRTGESSSDNSVKNIASSTSIDAIDSFETGKVIEKVICKNDVNQSYALYIPVNVDKMLPVVYFFDPHGDGSLPVKKYKLLADKYNFVLAGSNNSKNGNDWSTTENIWQNLAGDSQKRLKINRDRIYACGFSGGAKVAGYIALHHNDVKAVIANGAGLPDETPAGDFHFKLTFVAGEGDMNMTDIVAFNNDLDKTSTRHRLVFFDGIHEWATENTMNIAFAGLQLDAMYDKLIPKNETFINDFSKESKQQLEKYLASNNLVKAEQQCKLAIAMLDGLANNVNWFREKESFITHKPGWQQQWQASQNILVTEQKQKAFYMQQFQQGDIHYWTNTINDLEAKARVHTTETAMYQRLLAYLSLAFYSLSNRFITADQDAEARHFVDLYKLADPTNSESWYFSAILHARSHQVEETGKDLLKAATLGFTDQDRMMQQPEFQKLGPQLHLIEITNAMKRK